jgi:hypothetical protein
MFMINIKSETCTPAYLLGILNSELIRSIWLDKYNDRRRTFPKIKGSYLGQLPIKLVDSANATELNFCDRLVASVDSMLALHVRLAAAKTPHEATALQAQIHATDARIDAIVYELYGLSDAEIAIVEAATAG